MRVHYTSVLVSICIHLYCVQVNGQSYCIGRHRCCCMFAAVHHKQIIIHWSLVFYNTLLADCTSVFPLSHSHYSLIAPPCLLYLIHTTR